MPVDYEMLGRLAAAALAELVDTPEPAGPTGSLLPDSNAVYVAVAVSQHVVSVDTTLTTDAAAIGGPQGIFARQAARQTVERTRAEIVGVALTREDIDALVERHRRANPKVPHEYQVEVKAISWGLADEEPPTPVGCIECGTPTAGATRCQPCQNAFWEACRQADPEFVA
jgi:hypothetical protein